jgi:hypothetical protein
MKNICKKERSSLAVIETGPVPPPFQIRQPWATNLSLSVYGRWRLYHYTYSKQAEEVEVEGAIERQQN